ncbi:hypothetical protein J6S39_00170 [Candidatus Saccharibacteria bacterium]|nr:hypothetical protein [Candidatus Saccharibacteria bacterium]
MFASKLIVRYNGFMQARISKFFDECKLAAVGIVLAARSLSFVVPFLLTFLIFGVLISLLSGGSSAIDLFWVSDFGGKMEILWGGLLTLFGRGRTFADFLINFLLTFFQATLIGLIVFVFKKRKQNGLSHRTKSGDTSSIENASIATGLALLGSGCPTCGTTLITPILTSIFSSSSMAIAGTISGIMTAVAYVLIFWSLKKMGLEAYVIIKDEEWRKRRQKRSGRVSTKETEENE